MKKFEIKIGTVCNNNCIFCLNDKRNIYISTSDAKEQVVKAKSLGIEQINFTGGEPTIRKDFLELCAFVKENGMQLQVQTNARALSYTGYAKEACSLVDHFLVSLHAHNEALYEKLSGVKGGFGQVLAGIENIRMFGRPIAINVVISLLNIEHLPAIASHHSNLGVQSIQFSWARPQGKALQSADGIIPRYSRAELLKDAIEILVAKHIPVSVLGVPPCVMQGYERYLGDAYRDSFIIGKDELVKCNDWLRTNRKMKVPCCASCAGEDSCDGIFKGYVDRFGYSEFSPISRPS